MKAKLQAKSEQAETEEIMPFVRAKKINVEPALEVEILPSKIKMIRMWGFIDDDGHNHLWQAGQVVDTAEEIKMIIDCKFDAFKVIE